MFLIVSLFYDLEFELVHILLRAIWSPPLGEGFSGFVEDIKKDVVWLPMRQLSTKDQNDTDIDNYRSPYGLQKWAKPIPHSQLLGPISGLWLLSAFLTWLLSLLHIPHFHSQFLRMFGSDETKSFNFREYQVRKFTASVASCSASCDR